MTPENPIDPQPFLTGTNYKEIHKNEADALRSIYSTDFEDVEIRRAAWQVSVCLFMDTCIHTYAAVYVTIDTHSSGN